MRRLTTSLPIVLIFLLLALVIYFVYQAAKSPVSKEEPDKENAKIAKKEENSHGPDRFAQPSPGENEEGTPGETSDGPDEEKPSSPPSEVPGAGASPGGSETGNNTGSPPGNGEQGTPSGTELPGPGEEPEGGGENGETSAGTGEGAALSPGVAEIGEPSPDYTSYTTTRGDTPWLIAVKKGLGGKHWKKLLKANPGLKQEMGTIGRDTALPAGTSLNVPAEEKEKPAAPSFSDFKKYTVKQGDTPSMLALRYYGDPSPEVWKKILLANPGLDSSAMPIGEKIKLPVIQGKGPKDLPSSEDSSSEETGEETTGAAGTAVVPSGTGTGD